MNRHVQTIFCDDIRHEIGGKLSYIGVYSGYMFVPTFPITLPKLCLALSVLTPQSKPFRRLSLRVLKDEELLAEGSLDEALLAQNIEAAADAASGLPSPDRVQVLSSVFVFSPFNIEEPCILRVRAETESEELRGLALRIEQASPQQQPL